MRADPKIAASDQADERRAARGAAPARQRRGRRRRRCFPPALLATLADGLWRGGASRPSAGAARGRAARSDAQGRRSRARTAPPVLGRHRAHRRSRPRRRPTARLCRGPVLGAGRRGGDPGAAAQARRRRARARPLRRARAARRRSWSRPATRSPRSTATRPRVERLRSNLERLGYAAELVTADALDYAPDALFDGVLLDAPCSATGTFRRHPEVVWHRNPADIAGRVALQRRLIARAADCLKPGGVLIYCVCSLEPEEGEAQARLGRSRRASSSCPIAAGGA